MTKLNILRLDSTTENDTAATLNINTNFENIQKAIENTLSRDGSTPNYMDADLDMNSYRIINVGEAVDDTDAVSYKQFKEEIGEATVAASQAAASAAQAATSAQSALVSSTNAINSVRNAENVLSYTQNLLSETQDYVNAAKDDIAETASTNITSINKTVADAKQEINTAIDEAEMSLSNTIEQATEDVKQQALEAAQGAINDAAAQATTIVVDYANNEIKPQLNEIASNAAESAENAAESAGLAAEDAADAEHWANDARIWATGEDAEVETVAPGEEEHSSRGYADLAMAIANTPEDVPVDMSKLLALDVIKVPVVDLEGYVKNTDYAGDVGGVIKISAVNGLAKSSNGYLLSVQKTLGGYNSGGNDMFVSKGTLENIKNDLVKRAVTANDIELTADEKANAKAWLGYADNNDIAQAIASISQFKISIVDALPTAGEAKTLYLVPKEGTGNDVYNEYLWLEQDSKFEFLGTTAVDLTDYVKNTDYAGATTAGSAGIVKCSSTFACGCVNGYLQAANIPTLERYNNLSQYAFIGKATLQTALTQYSKTVPITESDYNALETKDTNTLYLIEEE